MLDLLLEITRGVKEIILAFGPVYFAWYLGQRSGKSGSTASE